MKDLIEELVSDNQIEKDKIGAGNYYWCFPSKGVTAREAQIESMESQINRMQDDMKSKRDAVADVRWLEANALSPVHPE